MVEKIYNNPEIYKIDIPLPQSPLRNLNCYVIKTPEENLIIDTGFNRPECKAAMLSGIDEIGLDLRKTKLFLTHVHSDHTGLVLMLLEKGVEVYMSAEDYKTYVSYNFGSAWADSDYRFALEGFPKDLLLDLKTKNPAWVYAAKGFFMPNQLEDGDKIQVGENELTCVFVPGHTPGQMCLYLKKEKIMFLGDEVLFDITPNICYWPDFENALGEYLKSLKKIRRFDIALALPGHRKNEMDVYERIDEILVHHENRLNNTLEIVKENPYSTAYEIASKMEWDMRGKCWDEFPVSQRWFAVGETIAHLDYLIDEGKIARDEEGDVFRYREAKKDSDESFYEAFGY